MPQSLREAYREGIERGDGAAVAVHLTGVGLSLVGFFLFVGSRLLPPGTDPWWQLREAAAVAAGVGIVAALLGAAVAGSYRHVEVAGGGAIAALVGVGVFVSAYPNHWNGTGAADLTVEAVVVFSVGLAALLAAVGATAIERTGAPLGAPSISEFDWVDDPEAEAE